ncbi:MAG: hypothetical protein ACJAXK_000272 [Yoonia sp.]|jgi:hypothetical protein
MAFAAVAEAIWDFPGTGTFIVQIIVLMFFHQIVLLGGKLPLFGKSRNHPPFGPFRWASLMIFIGGLAVSTIITLLTVGFYA